ncbi:MAG TPA: glycosyltransferase, partial [Gemmataceae bacterium]|nr:glycosyltransferase [Gemmataceae bacterium]
MNVVHLTASTLFGGPERQMLGLAAALDGDCRSVFLSFAEGGRCRAFLAEARRQGFGGAALGHDTPHLGAATRNLATALRRARADVLLCNGYKASLLGRVAARREGVPAVAVSRGWTAESWKVRIYEAADRVNLRWMDRVVCVSEGQAAKVRRAGVPAERVVVIRNAIRAGRFDDPDPAYRERLLGLFPDPPRRIVGAAGRLSPEKGFGVLVEAARRVLREDPAAGVVLFGDGALRGALARQVEAAGLSGRFVLAGFRADLDRYVPWLDVMALPSYTEGLPNVVLEACAAGVPVVATAVGGTPEVIEDGENGYLTPPGDAKALAGCVLAVLDAEDGGRGMGECGRRRVREEFTFEAQAAQYRRLFAEITGRVVEF